MFIFSLVSFYVEYFLISYFFIQEDDPDKQRKWEEKEMKKQMKKKIPKMKQLKVKSL